MQVNFYDVQLNIHVCNQLCVNDIACLGFMQI